MLTTAAAALGLGCGEGGDRCGPTSAVVARVIDGDTVELDSGERVRYLMVDTPESTTTLECFGEESASFNRQAVEGKAVTLRYDAECEDRFGRLLAYVSVADREINTLLVERGYACVLHIPPNGADRLAEFSDLEDLARALGRGLWSACEDIPCN
jgi:micrococcal nuclease